MDRSEADYGKQSSIPDKGTRQDFFDNQSNPEYGKADKYSRHREEDQEYNPTPAVDESGLSHSSEGSIANHGIFNAAGDIVDAGAGAGKKRSSSPHFLDGHIDSNAQ